MKKPWQIILVLIGIFAAGSVAGGFLTIRYFKDRLANRPAPEEWAPRHLKRLTERLGLTPEQEEQIRPIVRAHMELLTKIRNSSMAETKVVVEAMQREVSEKLTPDQRAKFEQMNRELREARDAREKADRAKRANADHPDDGPRPPPKDQPPGEKPAPPPDKPPGT